MASLLEPSQTTNLTNTSEQRSEPTDTKTTTFEGVLGVVIALVCIVGILGNTLVLIVIKRKPSMRSTTNYLLANLATADLLSLLGIIPVILLLYFSHPRGEVGHYLCVFLTAGNLSIIAQITSVLTLAILAFERYMALLKPMQAKRLTLDTVHYAMIFTWAVAVSFTVPYFVRTTRANHDIGMVCEQKWLSHTEKGTFLALFFILLFALPYCVIMYCYGAIIKGIYFSRTICPMDVAGSAADARSKRRIVEVLLIVTSMFTVSVGSFGIVNLLREWQLIGIHNKLFAVTASLLFVNSSCNPIIYAFRSSNYKRAFREILGLDREGSTT